jgi:signal transduction histidine kinase/putative methionine-R-sulfoxide reductase with GAF domain
MPEAWRLLSNSGHFVSLLIGNLVALVFVSCGLYVGMARRQSPAAKVFALFSISIGIAIAGLFDTRPIPPLSVVWAAALALAGGALIHLALIFPQPFRLSERYPFLCWLGYVPGLVIAGLAIIAVFWQPEVLVLAWRLEIICGALSVLVFLALMTRRFFTAPSPIAREQVRLICWGALIAIVPPLLGLALSTMRGQSEVSPVLLLPAMSFPIATGYSLVRQRTLDTDYILSRAVLYLLLSGLAVLMYALLVSGLTLVFGSSLQPTSPIAVGLMVFILALLLNPLRSRLQQTIDTVFFRGTSAYRERLQAFGHALTEAIDLSTIAGLLRQYVNGSLLPVQVHIFFHDALSDQYVAVVDQNNRPTTDLRFSERSALVQALVEHRSSIFLSDADALPAGLVLEKARLALLGSQVFIPMVGQKHLLGWVAMGPRRSSEPYTSRDLNYLETLCDQAALAVERAQVVADLERRIREMNVLSRVAQGTNFTKSFDDMLELIFAQTTQVIPTRDFRVTLSDKQTDTLSHVFFLENDERISQREHQPLSDGSGLEAEVIRSQHGLLTDDYDNECRLRQKSPDTVGIYGWMGVPLNAGAETIGVVSLGNRDPAVQFTEEQLSLLQAIADQAAAAIVKIRLLQETERRAYQLASLYEIGRSLTSTLELKPLLNQILKSATEILNCVAGSLFLVDQQTGELVFEVVIGPVASDLAGKRLPPGTGLVGEVVTSGQAIMANNVRKRKDWFKDTDQETGFITRDMLVVPMQVKDRVVGVIEVINKQDGLPFTPGDQELLTTFSSQATIAIENARLYTLTDQALAARVEELSVMQRIDRELNASLDVSRAMQITLDWAIRQTAAQAGLVGIVEDSSVHVMTCKGYSSELDGYHDKPGGDDGNPMQGRLPTSLPGLKDALASGKPLHFNSMPSNGSGEVHQKYGLLNEAKSLWIAPIRREEHVMGVLFLESRQGAVDPEEELAFLSRLSDHAAIAIANAQLYGEVQAANLAKSKFVSFVAHELKNPMSSIKGYTELVAGGMAGPVNEMQSSFLATVRSNVDRMNTIVSDLNDLTKIQVGSLRLEFKTVSMQEIVDESLKSLRRQIEEKELQLTQELPDDLPLVWGDQSRLSQVLLNLLSNAQKYNRPGGLVAIGAERCSSQVGGNGNLNHREAGHPGLEVVHVWVRDSGIGIPPKDQDKIFQQYFRTDIAKEAASGTGLGLNITRSLVEMQGGRIWFESVLDHGTTFHFTVPVAESG